MDKKRKVDSAVELQCMNLFENLGWTVELQKRIKGLCFTPDLALISEGRVCGYVETIGDQDKDIGLLLRKKDQVLNYIITSKPDLFVFTNGAVFDVFYHGHYFATQTVPPAPDGFLTMNRLMTYYEKLKEVKDKNE